MSTDLKSHLIEMFRYNLSANQKQLKKIAQLPEKSECIKLMSHLVNSQDKWMARLRHDPKAPEMSWTDPVYKEDELPDLLEKSSARWIDYLSETPMEVLNAEATFIGYDGGQWAAAPMDVAIQLNNHSVHHRAQMQSMIRKQGAEPDFLDYIGTRYRKIS